MSSMESSSSSSSSFYLSKDLLIEILLCLPIKTLLRFKSVCKSWFLLIEDSAFIDRHTALSSSSSSKLGTFIFQYFLIPRDIEKPLNIFSISGDGDVVKDLDLPPCYPVSEEQRKSIRMNGSCNGLICLYNYKLRDVFLWNPATHQCRLLPRSPFTFAVIDADVGEDFVAFGFDVETKDYKVVLVTFESIYRVQVYSLSRDSWRTLEDVVLLKRPLRFNNGGYLNGSYYCMGYTRKSKMPMEVLSFDFTKEISKTMPLPDELITYNYDEEGTITYNYDEGTITYNYDEEGTIGVIDSGIICLGEKIALSLHRRPANIYEIWVLNEVCVKESWTKLYRIGPYQVPHRIYRPVGISNNGEFIFVVTCDGLKLWLLNPSTQVMKKTQWDGNPRANVYSIIIRTYVYRCSLIPVCSTRNGSTSKLIKSQV